LEIYRVPVFEILKEIPTMAELSLSLSLCPREMEKEITSSQTQKNKIKYQNTKRATKSKPRKKEGTHRTNSHQNHPCTRTKGRRRRSPTK